MIAGLLLDGASTDEWKTAIIQDNLLQTRSEATAKRLARLIRNRLESMGPALWSLIKDGTAAIATHACLAAAVKHSILLADFLDLTLRDQYKVFAKSLSPHLWEDFIADCSSRDPAVANWSETTVRKLRTVVFHILEQAGYIASVKSPTLQQIHIERPVVHYLESNEEHHVLRCLRMTA